MSGPSIRTQLIVLPGLEDADVWRAQTRSLLVAGVHPHSVDWIDPRDPQGSLANEIVSPALRLAEHEPSNAILIPRAFLPLAQRVLCHKDPGKWRVLYRIAYRLTHGREQHLLLNAIDDDVLQATGYAKAVKRDAHKMKAFVRFRKITEDGREHFVSYYKPEHRVLPLVAPFFARRFSILDWTILTPHGSATWRELMLTFGPPASREHAPKEDALEDFWKTYYSSIFNPARANPRAMSREMPKKYWSTLPEASIIEELLAHAPDRTSAMKDRSIGAPAGGAEAFIPKTLPADKAKSLRVLSAASQACQGCDLYKDATHAVFGEGPPDAEVMFIGEQPGDQEDLAARPFVGPAGKLLDQALQESGIDREACYVTNAVKHFKWTPSPRGKRRIHAKPNAGEVRACKPWLEREIALVKPKVIVLLGATAAQSLLGATFRVTKSRGQVLRDTPFAGAVVATVHPSSILRAPDDQSRESQYVEFVNDLKTVARLLKRKPR